MAVVLDPDVGVQVATDAVERAIRAGATSAKAMHVYRERFEVNFETTEISLVRSTVSDDLSITVLVGDRKGSGELTGRDHDSVDRTVAQALEAARAGQPDPANVLPEDPAEAAASAGDTEPDRDAMIGAVQEFLGVLADDHPELLSRSCAYSFSNTWRSYANSHDRTQHARTGRYGLQVSAAGKRGDQSTSMSYTAVTSTNPIAHLADEPAIARVLADTEASFDARPVPSTFVGEVVFTPPALGALLGSFAQAIGGLALLRKATPYLDRLGEAIASPQLSLRHRPSQLAGAAPFDAEGFPNQDLDIVTDGVLRNFLIDWYTAHKLSRPMTTGMTDWVIDPGTLELDELIGGVERGIILGRYSGGNPNQNLDFSGVAKNSFYVEQGRIVGPISETMVAGNLAAGLHEVQAVSRDRLDTGFSSMPWVALGGITVSTK